MNQEGAFTFAVVVAFVAGALVGRGCEGGNGKSSQRGSVIDRRSSVLLGTPGVVLSDIAWMGLPAHSSQNQDRAKGRERDRVERLVAPVVAPSIRDEVARLTAAQACYVETEWGQSDCAAIIYVAAKRAARVHRYWPDVLRAYSAIGHGGRRARVARRFPWGDIPSHPPAFNQHWRELRAYIDRVIGGEVQDPCVSATHWGSRTHPTDVHRARRALRSGKWRVAYCSVPTANQFYREVAPRAEVLQ